MVRADCLDPELAHGIDRLQNLRTVGWSSARMSNHKRTTLSGCCDAEREVLILSVHAASFSPQTRSKSLCFFSFR